MTLKMADSIEAANLPDGFDAYLGYRDGSWPDFEAEVKRFPGKHVIGIAVTASDDGDGLDIEFRDATPDQAPGWVRRQHERGDKRPILYASISTMKAVTFLLHVNGIARSSVRLVSAHYGWGPHICGPHTCAYNGSTTPQMDGTQWTDAGAGLNGSQIDESELADDFFGTTPAPAPKPAPAPAPDPDPAPPAPDPDPTPDPDPKPPAHPDPDPKPDPDPDPPKRAPEFMEVPVAEWVADNPPWNSTLSGIAEHEHTTVDVLLEDNPEIKDPTDIQPGQLIKVRVP